MNEPLYPPGTLEELHRKYYEPILDDNPILRLILSLPDPSVVLCPELHEEDERPIW